ncbi:MAG: hypothetical protein J6I54_04240 [Bacteroidaceae bacterium]|nr:hypothetical protein [Bacteroidaceae bacterium]
MKVSQADFDYLRENMTSRMIQILVEEQGYDLETALDRIYTSPLYEKLSDANTGLFFQSPRYVLSYL